MDNPDTRFDQMLSRLRLRGFRLTPQRIAVLRILSASEGHPGAEDIYTQVKNEFPTTSLATVYKTITLLKELNEVLELGFSEGGNRYDGKNPFPHPHLICVKCKKVIDADLESLGDLTEELTQDTGFEILSHRLDFFGICPDCKGEGK